MIDVLIILLGKTISALTRLFGGGGSAFPGLVVERLSPRFMARQLKKLPEGVVIITGTNGKTTTTKAVVALLENDSRRVLTNQTGSNFTRGIVASLIQKSNYSGQLPYEMAVLELDEAFSRRFVQSVTPRFVLALNVMRDQLDRYGEVDTTAEMIKATMEAASEGVVVNREDRRLVSAAANCENVSYFGLSKQVREHMPSEDDLYGRKDKTKLPEADVVLEAFSNSTAKFVANGTTYSAKLSLAGLHNAGNIVAALAFVRRIEPNVSVKEQIHKITTIKAAFGRGEVITIGEKRVTLALVKNPAGFRQSLLSYGVDRPDAVVIAINDRFADGRDVSWLWDIEFTTLVNHKNIIITGIRAYDMAERLRYEGHDNAQVTESIRDTIENVLASKSHDILVYCTYTAMLEIRRLLSQKTDVEDVW